MFPFFWIASLYASFLCWLCFLRLALNFAIHSLLNAGIPGVCLHLMACLLSPHCFIAQLWWCRYFLSCVTFHFFFFDFFFDWQYWDLNSGLLCLLCRWFTTWVLFSIIFSCATALLYFFFFFLVGLGFELGFELAKQALYFLSYTCKSFAFWF
jgi:hypothetical protein